MNARERWHNVTHYKSFDRVFNCEFGYWQENFIEWQRCGLPEEINNNEKADEFFKFDTKRSAGVNVGLVKGFETKILFEDENYRIEIDGNGVKKKVLKKGASSIPHYLEFPLKDRESWKPFKERLQPDPARYPEDWEERKKRVGEEGLSCGNKCWKSTWLAKRLDGI